MFNTVFIAFLSVEDVACLRACENEYVPKLGITSLLFFVMSHIVLAIILRYKGLFKPHQPACLNEINSDVFRGFNEMEFCYS